MIKTHQYHSTVRWQSATGTRNYQSYERDHSIETPQKPIIEASSDPAFNGNPARLNPEELFLASIASCHMLWYLHLCSVHGVVVTAYRDDARGTMEESAEGSGSFTAVTLHPVVTVTEASMRQVALQLHQEANKFCFIANSLNFAVQHQGEVIVKSGS